MVRTFLRLQSAPLGFDAANLSIATVVLPTDPFSSSEMRNLYYRQLAERTRAIPGVRAVAAGTSPPLSSGAPMTVNTAVRQRSFHPTPAESPLRDRPTVSTSRALGVALGVDDAAPCA